MTSARPPVTEIRTALIKESQDFYRRRKPYSAALHDPAADWTRPVQAAEPGTDYHAAREALSSTETDRM